MAGEQQHQEQRYGAELDCEQFCCSVCLDLLKEPVTICCGHSYCRACIERCWDQEEEEEGGYSCPQCRETFDPRPVLRKNNMLAEVVVKLKRRRPRPPPPPLTGVDPSDVTCDFCGPRPGKATHSCLTCLASYCDEHVEPHYTVPVLQKHELVSTTVPLVDKMCTRHNRLMELYCERDEQLMCTECMVEGHKGHKLVPVSELKDETKKHLVSIRRIIQEKVQQRENKLEKLSQAEENLKDCAQTSLNNCGEIFAELISSMQRAHGDVEQLIKAQKEAGLGQAEELRQQLEEELTALRRRDAELQRLLITDDIVHMMQSRSISDDSEDFAPSVGPLRSFRPVVDFVSELRDKMDILLKETRPKISTTVSYVDFSLPPPPNTRQEFSRYWRPLTLDETTNYPHLYLLHNYHRMRPSPSLSPANPNRFTQFPQVLCRDALTDRQYWEVEWHARSLSAAVAYSDANRSSDESEFGRNEKSWALECSKNALLFRHNNVETKVPGFCSDRIGVFLDYKAGILSFYQTSEPMSLIFEVKTTFTKPLHPGLGINYEWYDVGVFAQLANLP